MTKKISAALMLGIGLSLASPFAVVNSAQAETTMMYSPDEQAALDTMQAAIEALIVANAGDFYALVNAIAAYVEASDNPELAAAAVTAAANNPKSVEAQEALTNNGSLLIAAAQGLSVAIVNISQSNPELGASMQAAVESSDNGLFATYVTASVRTVAQANLYGASYQADEQQSIPEDPGSPN